MQIKIKLIFLFVIIFSVSGLILCFKQPVKPEPPLVSFSVVPIPRDNYYVTDSLHFFILPEQEKVVEYVSFEIDTLLDYLTDIDSDIFFDFINFDQDNYKLKINLKDQDTFNLGEKEFDFIKLNKGTSVMEIRDSIITSLSTIDSMISIPIYIRQFLNISRIEVEIFYDKDFLNFHSATLSEKFSNLNQNIRPSTNIRLTLSSSPGRNGTIHGNGQIIWLNFQFIEFPEETIFPIDAQLIFESKSITQLIEGETSSPDIYTNNATIRLGGY